MFTTESLDPNEAYRLKAEGFRLLGGDNVKRGVLACHSFNSIPFIPFIPVKNPRTSPLQSELDHHFVDGSWGIDLHAGLMAILRQEYGEGSRIEPEA